MLSVEFYAAPKTSWRGVKMLQALNRAAQKMCHSRLTREYEGQSDWLVVYGAGGDDRYPQLMQHKHSGRRIVTFDLGYWDRENQQRVSIDDMHPQNWIWRKTMPACRFEESGIQFRDVANPSGPVIYALMGRKSAKLYGSHVDQELIAQARQRYPGHRLKVREKPTDRLAQRSIDDDLNGASLMVSHHSNASIDAIISGVPFECEDGAAKAYKGDRPAFMRQLAWFQWRPEEADSCFRWLRDITGD